MRKFSAVAVLLFAAASTVAAAQESDKNEIAVTVGRIFISDQAVPNAATVYNTVHFGKGLSFEGDYARKLRNYGWGTLSVEVPVVVNPDEDLNYGLNQIPKQYSSIFVTPAARVNFLQDFAFSPWVSFGGGLAHYVASKDLVFFGANPGHRVDNSGTLEAGIGFDVKIPRFDLFRFRFEARDFWTGEPPINVDTGHTRQHNYLVAGGAVFHF
jgi:hypothetical protein